MKRCEGEDVAQPSAIGLIPKAGSINMSGLKEPISWEELFSLPKEFWREEVENLEQYFGDQFGNDLPNALWEEVHKLKQRVDML